MVTLNNLPVKNCLLLTASITGIYFIYKFLWKKEETKEEEIKGEETKEEETKEETKEEEGKTAYYFVKSNSY